MEPVVLDPALKDIIWGGRRMESEFGYSSGAATIAEAWVVSAHPDGQSTARGGKYAGMPLGEILKAEPELCGNAGSSGFPLLIKFIDARRDLSVQVHPDDAYAAAHGGGRGKTEAWYILAADPGAFIYYGFKRRISRRAFAAAIENGTICSLLNKVECRAGDVFLIPAGTVHAIGAGLLICEIQQSSNCTFRIFDYGRPGPDGKPRQLHIEQASQVARLGPPSSADSRPGTPYHANGALITELVSCPYFKTSEISAEHSYFGAVGDTFELLTVLGGAAELIYDGGKAGIRKGDGVLLPAGLGRYSLEGAVRLLKTSVR